jgi:hypothetical protein
MTAGTTVFGLYADVHGLARTLHALIALAIVAAVLGYSPVTKGSPADVIAALALVLAFGQRPWRAHWPVKTLLAVAAVLALGVAQSPVPLTGALAAAKILLWLMFACVVARSAVEHDAAQRLVRLIIAVSAGYAAVGCALSAVGLFWPKIYGTQYYPDFPLGFGATRWVGFYPTANDMALVFVLALLLLPFAKWPRRPTLGAAVVLSLGLFATWSRLVVLPVVWAAAHLPRRLRPWGVGAACALWLGSEWITHVAVTRTPHSVSSWVVWPAPFAEVGGFYFWRMGYLDLKLAALAMWWQHPWCGVGLRGFGEALPAHVPEVIAQALPFIGSTPHSTYGMVLAELGSVGAIVLGGLLFWFWRRSALRHCAIPIALILMAGLDYELQHHRLVYFVISLFSALASNRRDSTVEERHSSRKTIEPA